MPTSTSRAFVWVWLPGQTQPVPAALLRPDGTGQAWELVYGRRYLERADAVSLSPTLPLGPNVFPATADLGMPGAIRDGAPDNWGRRVILNAHAGKRGRDADTDDLDHLTYLLESGSDRLGGIDFQASADEYIPRGERSTLDDLQRAAQLVEAGEELPDQLSAAVMHGTSLGGAAPKATLVDDDGREYLAKFSTADAYYPVIKAEAVSIDLARRIGIDVPAARLTESLRRDVLLIDRFDRPGDGTRRMVVSALTLLGLGEIGSRSATYLDLLARLRELGAGADVGRTLFQRIAFNMAISNTDDHPRNHAAYWNGHTAALTPTYDLSPMPRVGETAYQAMAYGPRGERDSKLARLRAVGSEYGLTSTEAREIIQAVVDGIEEHWLDAADAARLTSVERDYLWRRQFLNKGSLYDL
ncbi:type II toxin-antitoxin system HipA family toxin [Clavibacter nebraskensis]|uniref:type II toxin-antitoxin system HipA family toxin n=1 Tax=Clavibacter nebraskensis TaxID=31963 RepID=UPI003F4B6439